MSLNMKSITQALAKTAAVIEKTVQTTVQEVSGPKALQDYDLIDQIGSAGPGLAWRLYSAKASRDSSRAHQYTTVCVWLLDKRALSDARSRAGLSRAAEDSFLDLVRADAARLVRLRHPGVVHVVQALDETKTAMAMVTEPLFASAANALGLLDNLAKVPKELQGMKMGVLEVKHGLLQIAETLEFLHNNARLVHRAIAPENVIITSSGAWKLGGFGFAVSVDNTAADTTNAQAFHYAEYDVEDSILPLQPSLNYTAPELVKSRTSSVGCSSDIFSLGCLAYHLIAHKSLFDCHNNVKMYMNTLNYLSSEAFSSIPSELVPDLQRMLSANESSRPSAMDFTGSPFFRNDTRLRALRFLDHMLERDNMQKSEFLKALSDMWKDFDSRVLRYKVLPPLCAELRNLVMQPMILPMVLTIAEAQEKNDFELSTLPALDPVLSTAAGDTLLLLMKHAELIINKTNQEHLISHVLPMIVRAYDDTDVRIQEEVLKKSSILAKHLDVQLVKQAILPRVHGLALKTTVAAVRVNALLCLGDLVPTLDKHAVLEILQTIQRCTAVDHSAPTLMCTLGVANSILKQYGIEFTAEHVLPLLIPLLTATQLNVQQFAKYMLFVKDILRKIEENRGVTVTDSGTSEMRQNPITNGVQSQAPNQASGAISASTKKSPAWDEDWGIARKQPAPSAQNSTNRFTPHVGIEQSQATHSQPNQPSNKQTASSHLPVDLEWPPRASSGVTLNAETPTNSNFDNMDPFADWPPRQSGQPSGIGASNYGSSAVPNTSNTLNNNNNSWAFDNQTSIGQMRQSQGNSGTTASLGSLKQNQGNSLGFMKQSQGDLGYIERKPADISSIFSNSKSEQSALRLAPPPSTAVGRGQGRGRLSSPAPRSTSQAKKPSEQASLLDLL